MIASLPMYQRPELVAAHDRYWQLIRSELAAAGINSPSVLSQDGDERRAWTDPNLVLSQTCGMPYRTSLHATVTLVGTPDYGLEGCEPGYYRSAIVIRKGDRRTSLSDFAKGVFAYNSTGSQSGYAAAFAHTAACGFWFDEQLQTGQHLASAKAVAAGTADIASLDAVSWRLMERYESFADNLTVLEWTEPTPGLPYIARLGVDQQAIFVAVSNAIGELTSSDRGMLGLVGLVAIPSPAYRAIANPPVLS